MLEESLQFQADHDVTEDESTHLNQHAKRIKYLLTLLVPREPLDLVSLFVRMGIAILLFFLLIAPPYTYVRTHYLAGGSVIETSGVGTTSTRAYVPEVVVDIAAKLWTRGEVDGPVAFTHSQDFRGMTAGIVPADVNGHSGVAVYWTESNGEKLVLRRLVTDEFFRTVSTVSSTVWNDQDFTSAVAVSSGTTAFVVAAYSEASGPKAAIQTFDAFGQPLVPRRDFPFDESGESIEDVQAVPWEGGWAMTNRIPRKPGDSLFDPTRVVVRLFDWNLNPTRKMILEIAGYEIGKFPQLVPNLNPSAKGFTIIANAHPAIRDRREPTGDNLYAFQFGTGGDLTRLLKLTNNGRQHDFWPTGFAVTESKDYVIGVMNIPGYSFDDPTEVYPRDSGRAYLRFYDQTFQIAGTLIVHDEPAIKDAPDTGGVSHLRQVIIGGRVYVAYDFFIPDSSITDKPDRSVQGMWMRLKH